jgi:ADP-ribose pyrophosphatase YjhB (NUDIX family)
MPTTTVAAAVCTGNDDEGFVLLTKRAIDPYKGLFCLPGGHIEPNETAEAAVIREVKEETGLDVIALEFAGYRDEIVPEKNIHNIVLLFVCETTGEIKVDPNEVSDFYWEGLDKAEELELAFDHKELIKMI